MNGLATFAGGTFETACVNVDFEMFRVRCAAVASDRYLSGAIAQARAMLNGRQQSLLIEISLMLLFLFSRNWRI